MTAFDDFEKMKKTGLPEILVIYGEEQAMVQELKEQFLSWVNYDPADMAQSYFDLASSDRDLALEELESLPFFSDSHLVIFENLSNVTTVKKKVFDDKQMARFESYLGNPSETTQLVIILSGKLDNRLKATKLLKKSASLIEAKELNPKELASYFSRQTNWPTAPLNKIFEKSNFSFSVIKQNIELVKTYIGDKEISLEAIEKAVPKSLQDNVFDLTSMIFSGRIEQARSLVADLRLQGQELIQILAILNNNFRLYYKVALMRERGWSEQQQVDFLKANGNPRQHPYPVKLANQAVSRMAKGKLATGLQILVDLDYQLKSSSANKDFLFDLALIKLSEKKA
ncbi:DNA polymerase III subunit delta [Lactococcus termiticola]|uniref:DNA polymerase III subunit delta n=1 Tax=Lactococcus termiticola TaxID=2169526 RepID=A0A2R5HGG3_9LACT|nr:DNA polymerase III subunit delta [Lactococcus termiticola]GBG97139.1 DNA polymerase III subunit delta [Lactococcus termiticola]